MFAFPAVVLAMFAMFTMLLLLLVPLVQLVCLFLKRVVIHPISLLHVIFPLLHCTRLSRLFGTFLGSLLGALLTLEPEHQQQRNALQQMKSRTLPSPMRPPGMLGMRPGLPVSPPCPISLPGVGVGVPCASVGMAAAKPVRRAKRTTNELANFMVGVGLGTMGGGWRAFYIAGFSCGLGGRGCESAQMRASFGRGAAGVPRTRSMEGMKGIWIELLVTAWTISGSNHD